MVTKTRPWPLRFVEPYLLRALVVCLIVTGCASELVVHQQPLPRPKAVPILMYHRIVQDSYWATVPDNKKPEYFKRVGVGDGSDPYLYLRSKSHFEAEMAHLAEHGYTPISLYELREYISSRNPSILPEKPVVITFDDGSSDWFDTVLPILARYNFKATFFVITNDQVRGKDPTGYAPLSWEQIQRIASHKTQSGTALFDIESHTHNHVRLTEAVIKGQNDSAKPGRYSELRVELEESVKVIEQKLGRKPRFLALPYGAGGWEAPPHSQAFPVIKSVAQELGYYGIRTSRQNIANDYFSDIYKLGSQIVIHSSTSIDEFGEKLTRFSSSGPFKIGD